MHRRIPSRFAALAAIATLAFSPTARALEHVTLRNGFSLDCSHHDLIGPHIRLYTSKDETSYQDLPADQVATIDQLPDPPEPKPIALATTPVPQTDIPTLLNTAGQQHNIDAELLASVVHAESNFRTDATSRAGARGLMQLMPGTARDLGVTDVTRPDQNINGGTAYLDSLLKLYHDDVRLALAAYNAGPANVAKYHGVPPFRETRAYVNRIIREFNRRKAALTTTVASR